MKIGDVKVGAEYGAAEGSRKRVYGDLPRRVTVLGVEKVEQEIWTGGGFASTRGKRIVRQLRVRMEDEPLRKGTTWDRNGVAVAEKGKELVIEARLLVAPWSELRADVTARITAAQREAEAKEIYEARIRRLLPKKMQGDWFYVKTHSSHGGRVSVQHESRDAAPGTWAEVNLNGRVLDTILELAEKGAK